MLLSQSSTNEMIKDGEDEIRMFIEERRSIAKGDAGVEVFAAAAHNLGEDAKAAAAKEKTKSKGRGRKIAKMKNRRWKR